MKTLFVSIFSFSLIAFQSKAQPWDSNGDNSCAGELSIGSNIQENMEFIINGSWHQGYNRDISYKFAGAGTAKIRSYRGQSWDTHLQFLTSSYSNPGGNPSARMTINGDGNIGIGTSEPEEILDLRRDGAVIRISSNTYYGGDGQHQNQVIGSLKFNNFNAGNTSLNYSSEVRGILTHGWATGMGLSFVCMGNERMRIKSNGDVGIGTTDPDELLHLKGDQATIKVSSDTYYGENGEHENQVIGSLKFNNFNAGNTSLDYSSEVRGVLTHGWATSMGLSFVCMGNERMRIESNGNIGIGTTSPNSKLTVKGKIHCEEVLVDLNVPGPDYVFEDDYNLWSLGDTKAYIQANKHLPEIPSAKEMEENGINMSEMNMLLLKKIEELTLHQIELLEQLQKQNKRLEELESNK